MATLMNMHLYRWLMKQGAEPAEAEAAAQIDTSELATKQDLIELRLELKAEIARLSSELTWRMVLMTGAFIAAVAALKVFA